MALRPLKRSAAARAESGESLRAAAGAGTPHRTAQRSGAEGAVCRSTRSQRPAPTSTRAARSTACRPSPTRVGAAQCARRCAPLPRTAHWCRVASILRHGIVRGSAGLVEAYHAKWERAECERAKRERKARRRACADALSRARPLGRRPGLVVVHSTIDIVFCIATGDARRCTGWPGARVGSSGGRAMTRLYGTAPHCVWAAQLLAVFVRVGVSG